VYAKGKETVDHLLSACNTLSFTLHKKRHDRVVYQLLLALCRKYQLAFTPPLSWRSDAWTGVGIVEGPLAKIEVDLTHPMDKSTKHHRPDLMLTIRDRYEIWILEVACAWKA